MANPRLDAVTKSHVTRAAERTLPKTIQKWSVVVSGKKFPVKQLLMEAANLVPSSAPRVTPADFIAHAAVRKLRRLGFKVDYSG